MFPVWILDYVPVQTESVDYSDYEELPNEGTYYLEKPALFKIFYKWLKLGGEVLISDYYQGPETPSETFGEYLKQKGYDLRAQEVKSPFRMIRLIRHLLLGTHLFNKL